MTKSFSLFLALRFLKPKRTFLSIITLISVLGVTLGVMVLILVISVMHGFQRELEDKVLGFDAHIQVTSSSGVMDDWEKISKQCAKIPGVVAVAPYVQGPVIAQFNNKRLAPVIRGIDPDIEKGVTDLKKYILPGGTLDLDGENVVVGSELARELGVQVGDTIDVYSPNNIENILTELDHVQKQGGDQTSVAALKQMILPMQLKVTGIFESGRYVYDSEFLIAPLFAAQELYDLHGGVHGLSIKTTDPYKAQGIRDRINDALQDSAFAMTWIDMNKQMFDAISMERHVMFFLLMFIIIVAAFGIMNTLITVTVQKTREIGIMKALGAQTFQIIGIFLGQGMVVGFFGTLTGLFMGITLIQYRNDLSYWLSNTFGIEIFPAQIYEFDRIPAQIIPSDVAIICICAFVICSIAALIPAWFAARLDPVKALRYE